MKTEFKAKFLQHLNQKKQQEGFTLIELLVVVIIIGILAAVALPSLLSQANKAKQVEARNNIGAINRAQQAVFLETSAFATNMGDVGVGIQTQSTNYEYTFNPATSTDATQVANLASTRVSNLKPYTGLVWTVADTTTNQSTTRALLCEQINPITAAAGGDPAQAVPATSCPAATMKTLE